MSKKKKVLIVEDEILIAKRIKKKLEHHNYECVGINIDYKGAINSLETKSIDLVLLDININGEKSGLDIAEFINKKTSIPFFFLTTYNDIDSLNKIKSLHPIGYLNKPINESTLITNIDINFNAKKDDLQKIIFLKSGAQTYKINLEKLIYVTSEHVYLRLKFVKRTQYIRISLTHFLKQLPETGLIQINRSTAVNPIFIDEYRKNKITIKGEDFKISDSFRDNFSIRISEVSK